MRGMRTGSLLISLLGAAALTGCVTQRVAPAALPPSGGSAAGTAQPEGPAGEPPTGPPERPAAPPPRQFRLGTATNALVAQAHRQAGSGDNAQAAATLERAMRIEPDNPLLWIELGRVRLGENNPVQADAMGRKALALASGDAGAQASAWRLIADSYHARGRDPDASEAERRAATLAPR